MLAHASSLILPKISLDDWTAYLQTVSASLLFGFSKLGTQIREMKEMKFRIYQNNEFSVK